MPTEITLFDVSLALCLASFLATMVCLLANAFPALIERLKQVTAVDRAHPSELSANHLIP